MRQVHFFRGHGGEVAAPFVRFKQDFVGQDVEFFLRFALHIVTAGFAEDATQAAFANGNRNALTGPGNDLDQEF